jgi:hypothetical protein
MKSENASDFDGIEIRGILAFHTLFLLDELASSGF